MVLVKLSCILLVCVCAFSQEAFAEPRIRERPIYSNHFAVHIPGNEHKEIADEVASKHGFFNRGQVRYRLSKFCDLLQLLLRNDASFFYNF